MKKNKWIAWFLCLIFGIFGVHKFYLGQPVRGILYSCTFGFAFIAWFWDSIFLLLISKKEFDYKFNYDR